MQRSNYMTVLTIEECVLKVVDKPELLQVRDKVELRISTGDDVIIFNVRVEDITQAGIFIDRPIIDRGVFKVTSGERIGIEYRRGMVKYRFSSLVVGEGRLGAMPVILIQHPHHIDRIRHKLRRKWLRLNIPTKIVFINKTKPEKTHLVTKYGIIKDVSGGGLRFVSLNTEVSGLSPGDRLQLTFNLSSEVSVIEQEAKVIRIEPCTYDKLKKEIIVVYQDISIQLSEAIIIHNVKHQSRYSFGKRKP